MRRKIKNLRTKAETDNPENAKELQFDAICDRVSSTIDDDTRHRLRTVFEQTPLAAESELFEMIATNASQMYSDWKTIVKCLEKTVGLVVRAEFAPNRFQKYRRLCTQEATERLRTRHEKSSNVKFLMKDTRKAWDEFDDLQNEAKDIIYVRIPAHY
jgi:hypothetical protein